MNKRIAIGFIVLLLLGLLATTAGAHGRGGGGAHGGFHGGEGDFLVAWEGFTEA